MTAQLVGMTQLRKVPPEENAPNPNTPQKLLKHCVVGWPE